MFAFGYLGCEVVGDLMMTNVSYARLVSSKRGGIVMFQWAYSTLPFSVVAAKSCASASVEPCKIDIVVVQASFYSRLSNTG